MDNKKSSWLSTHRPTKRRLIQLYSALLYNANLKGFINGNIYTGKTKSLCVPGFNCYSCPGAVGACPLGSLQASLAASDKQIGFYIVGIFLLYGLIAGRTICGWACPMGLIQELLHKIPTPKIRKSRITRALSYLKYIILAVFVFAVTLWYGLRHSMAVPGFCKYICPAGTLEGAMGLLSNPNNSRYFGMLGILFTRKFIIMLVLGLLCIFCYRAFCRFLCPLGAIYGMFDKLALIGVKVDMDRCSGCGSCVQNCKMDVRRVGDHECIHCGQCMTSCAKGAISLKAGKFTLKAPEKGPENDNEQAVLKRKRIEECAWIAALIVLSAALLWYNVFDNMDTGKDKSGNKTGMQEVSEKADDVSGEDDGYALEITDDPAEEVDEFSLRYSSDAPIGNNIGDQLEDFTAELTDGSTFRLSDEKGKVVVINLWATWCGPCVQELPHFYDFYHEHGDDVAVLTCHSRFGEHDDVYEDVREFLKDKPWDTPVAIDDDENGIFEKTGGSETLPQTIVLNRKGEVIYNEVRSVTPEMLEKLYDKAAMGEAPGEYKKYMSGGQGSNGSDEIVIINDPQEDEDTDTEETADSEVKEDETEDEAASDEAEDEADTVSDNDELQTEISDAEDITEEKSESDINGKTGLYADIKYDISSNRITISGNYVKTFIEKNGITSKDDLWSYLKKHISDRQKRKNTEDKGDMDK